MDRTKKEILYKEESYAIVGACMRVHSQLGTGFLETVYQEALSREFDKQNIPYSQEKELIIYYDGVPLDKKYKADFICYDKIILELKATKSLTDIDKAQLINYLKATKLRLGLLVNFGEKRLIHKRLIV